MSDIPMLAWYVWGVYCWVKGFPTKNPALLSLAALCCALSFFHKYYGITAVPLLFAWSLARERKPGWWMLYLAAPIAAVALYSLWSYWLYGAHLLAGAAQYAVELSQEKTDISLPAKSFIGIVFTGGCMISALAFMPWLWTRRAIAAFFALAVLSAAIIAAVGVIGKYPLQMQSRYNWPVLAHASIFFLTGLSVLALACRDLYQRRDADALLLFLWLFGAFAFSTHVNWAINARTILPMAPALGILIARAFVPPAPVPGGARRGSLSLRLAFALAAPLVLSAAVSAAVLWGDWQLANAQRVAAAKFARDDAQLPVQYFYKGHWGFQYYMDRAGIPDWDVRGIKVNLGDRIVLAENSSTIAKFNEDVARAWPDLRFQTPASRWVSTMHPYVGAGFYIYYWGPLPYAFGNVPPEYYAVYEIGDYRNVPFIPVQ
jgi:hypothetical protein